MRLIHADARRIPLADGVVQCVVTSPPYFGLRSYGTPPVTWDDGWVGELGLEPTPELYVRHIVEIFREVKRVLRSDGTVWLNLGDSYAGSGKGGQSAEKRSVNWQPEYVNHGLTPAGLKPKDLVGIPWAVAFALRADGWWLRQDNVWAKGVSGQQQIWDNAYKAALKEGLDEDAAKRIADAVDPYVGNPMPESVKDRCTRSHEYLFLLTKSARYFYDKEAIAEPSIITYRAREKNNGESAVDTKRRGHSGCCGVETATRNRRSVWVIPTKSCKLAHFAVMPEDLVEPCILAGSKQNDIVLDPFAGSGTVGAVCAKYGRAFVGLDLKWDYLDDLARERVGNAEELAMVEQMQPTLFGGL